MTPAPPPQLRVISYGGGVQSTALLVLAAQGRIDFKTFLMANVGDDSEHPATLEYVRNVAMPYAAEHGIDLQLLDRIKRDGTVETLWGRLMDPKTCRACRGSGWRFTDHHTDESVECDTCDGTGKVQSRSLPIPVRMDNGAPGTRSCTADFKMKVTARWLKRHGATAGKPCHEHSPCGDYEGTCPPGIQVDCEKCVQPNIATIGIGISLDEIARANNRRSEPHERVVYPLIGLGEETGLKLTRQDCRQVIQRAGLPVPPKSSCFFCPFHRPSAWEDMQRERPDLFDKSVQLERTLNDRRRQLGKDPVWLTRFARPLDEAIKAQDLLPLEDISETDGQCDSGWCFT